MNENNYRWRILAVDDHEDTLEVIRMTLSDDYDILTIKDPAEIYEMINMFEPDLLILDIMMPKITGFQVLDLLQKNPKYKNIPVIILSAKDTTREIKYGYKLGARLYLTKPFEPERLLRNVELLFERTPPARGPKKHSLKQILVHLQVKEGYKNGQLSVSSSLLDAKDALKSNKVKEAKKKSEERKSEKGDQWMD